MAEGRRPFNSSMIYPSQRSQTSFVKEPWCYPSLRRPSYLVRYLNSSVDAHRRKFDTGCRKSAAETGLVTRRSHKSTHV